MKVIWTAPLPSKVLPPLGKRTQKTLYLILEPMIATFRVTLPTATTSRTAD